MPTAVLVDYIDQPVRFGVEPILRPAQYRANRYTGRLAEVEAVASVGSKGYTYDNAMGRCAQLAAQG